MSYFELANLYFTYGNLQESLEALKQAKNFTSKDFTKIDLAALFYKLRLLNMEAVDNISFDIHEEFPSGNITNISLFLE